ncbi:hypothetical protein E2320_014451, partial [Naja naja]
GGGDHKSISPLVLISSTSHQRLQTKEITAGVANKPGDPVLKTTIPFLLNSIFLQLISMKVPCTAEQPLHLKIYTGFVTAPNSPNILAIYMPAGRLCYCRLQQQKAKSLWWHQQSLRRAGKGFLQRAAKAYRNAILKCFADEKAAPRD